MQAEIVALKEAKAKSVTSFSTITRTITINGHTGAYYLVTATGKSADDPILFFFSIEDFDKQTRYIWTDTYRNNKSEVWWEFGFFNYDQTQADFETTVTVQATADFTLTAREW
jgi:hypothetical protein